MFIRLPPQSRGAGAVKLFSFQGLAPYRHQAGPGLDRRQPSPQDPGSEIGKVSGDGLSRGDYPTGERLLAQVSTCFYGADRGHRQIYRAIHTRRC
jgi:hypothetical protein